MPRDWETSAALRREQRTERQDRLGPGVRVKDSRIIIAPEGNIRSNPRHQRLTERIEDHRGEIDARFRSLRDAASRLRGATTGLEDAYDQRCESFDDIDDADTLSDRLRELGALRSNLTLKLRAIGHIIDEIDALTKRYGGAS